MRWSLILADDRLAALEFELAGDTERLVAPVAEQADVSFRFGHPDLVDPWPMLAQMPAADGGQYRENRPDRRTVEPVAEWVRNHRPSGMECAYG
jgi:hypothetical protein